MWTYDEQMRCRRPGCYFERSYMKDAAGKKRLKRHCGVLCYVWCRRAAGAMKYGDTDGAAELLRLSRLLDARMSPTEFVPGVVAPR